MTRSYWYWREWIGLWIRTLANKTVSASGCLNTSRIKSRSSSQFKPSPTPISTCNPKALSFCMSMLMTLLSTTNNNNYNPSVTLSHTLSSKIKYNYNLSKKFTYNHFTNYVHKTPTIIISSYSKPSIYPIFPISSTSIILHNRKYHNLYSSTHPIITIMQTSPSNISTSHSSL